MTTLRQSRAAAAPAAGDVAAQPVGGDDAIAAMHAQLGNAAVAEALGARLSDTEPEPAPDFTDAEAFNRAHIVDVVRFDRATHGRFARGDGQIDAKRLAAWQREHGIAPADGRVTENACMVAEGKPPLPAPAKDFEGSPEIEILHPRGETYPSQTPIGVTVKVTAAPGSQVRLRAALTKDAPGLGPSAERDAWFEMGNESELIVDLRFDEDLPPGDRWRVDVDGVAGDATVVDTQRFQIGFAGKGLQQFATPPSSIVGPGPGLPDPAPFVAPVDQAAAEAWNRDRAPLVVRFDRATHGYFAKPNGELDALAVAEYQREHERDGLRTDGMLDDDTVRIAERDGGGLHPRGADPAQAQWHGPPEVEVVQPVEREPIFAGSKLRLRVKTRADMRVFVSWMVSSVKVDLQARGVIDQRAGEDGTVELEAVYVPDSMARRQLDDQAELAIAVSTSLGAAPLAVTTHTALNQLVPA